MGILHTQNDEINKMFYYLHLNETCNLRCSYCYYEKLTDINQKNISYKPSDLINSINESNVDHHVITFYGKEPLLSLDFIREIFDITKSNNSKKKLILV